MFGEKVIENEMAQKEKRTWDVLLEKTVRSMYERFTAASW